MKTFNANKQLTVEIHSNSGCCGYTVYHVKKHDHGFKRVMSQRADGKDFDWMTDKQVEDFEAGKYLFTMTASQATEFFSYLY